MFYGDGGNRPDYKELPFYNYQQWLGGIFEACGAMYFEIREQTRWGRTHVYAYPFIKLSDNDELRVQKFQNLVGGKIDRSRNNTHQWWMIGEKAVALAQEMAPFSPSRHEIIMAFENWYHAEIEERIEIAREISESETDNNLTKDDYRLLVSSPPFLAGVLDARASFYMNETFNVGSDKSYGWVYPRMHVNTTNVPLVEALQERYGGNIEVATHRGETRRILGQIFPVRHDSVRWNIGHETYNEITAMAGPYIQLRTLDD